MHVETSGGIVLIVMTIIAIIWANSPLADVYFHLLETKIVLGFGDYRIDESLHYWINDGLMAIFFFLVGLEIKRELLIGELSTIKTASLPIIAAFGGMLVPALIYLIFNPGGEGQKGWGIPMATDIAFSIGILALLGSKAPFAIKVFLTAFAIVDDIGAVLVIAMFYTADISLVILGIAAFFLLILIVMNFLHVRAPSAYIVIGLLLWAALLKSGIHATIAGILLAFTIPAKARINSRQFLDTTQSALEDLKKLRSIGKNVMTSNELSSIVYDIEDSCEAVQTPSQRIQDELHLFVAFFIMPLFAFANAGVKIDGNILNLVGHPVSIGIIFGLFFGKQIGVFVFSWLAVKLKIAEKPHNISWITMYGAACLGGIGFTMSLFIASLAFGSLPLAGNAKIGILAGSLISGILGYVVIKKYSSDKKKNGKKIFTNNL
ncbi:MAG: Na+/H+ antiporter NhaA [Ignavibacteriae bacterium]|nr:MAG: Na+/H+ antiporter NhaA [Ignavibacteriota bacterium]